MAEKKLEYEKKRKTFFDYKDKHRNVVQERVNIKSQQLNDEYELSLGMFKSLSQQAEQARLAVKEQMPAFTELDPVQVPTERSAPKRPLILVISGFLGVFLGIGAIFSKLMWGKMKEAF